MPKQSKALSNLTPATLSAIETMGSHLALARVRRKESLATRARRVGVLVPTRELIRGEPVFSLKDAYDIVTTGSGAIAHEFMIADDVVDPDLEAAILVHPDFGLQEDEARAMVSEIVRLVDGWRGHFSALGVTDGDLQALAEFIDRPDLLAQREQHRSPPARSPRSRAAVRKPKTGTPRIFR